MSKSSRAVVSRSKPSTSKPSTSTKLAAVHSVVADAKRVSAADRTHAEELLALIARKKQRIAEDFYEIGVALRELQKKKLHVALGFASFGAMLEGRKVMSASQAFKLIKLVAAVPREQALSMGQEKAFALLRYAEATPEVDTPQSLMESGTLPGGRRVAEASVRELDAAVKGARGKSARKKQSPEELAAHREAAATQAALRKRGARDAIVTAVRSKGVWWVRAQVRVEAGGVLRGDAAGKRPS